MKYNLVNWVDGMKISKVHFQQTENFFIENLYDLLATQLTPYNYGLLPASDGETGSSEIKINQHVTDNVEVRLHRCNAITAGGCRVSYNPSDSDEGLIFGHIIHSEDNEQNHKVQSWDLILSVDPFLRTPSGTPDEEEMPPRHPDAVTSYNLSVVPQGKLHLEQLGLHHLIIGRIRLNGGRYEVDSNYIPPCTCMASHPDLLNYYEAFRNALIEIERCSKIIIGKVLNRSQNAPLAIHLASVCRELMRYVSTIYFSYQNQGRYYTPVEVVSCISTLAHVCYTSLTFISKTEKEELLKYLYEWSDITPGNFESMLSNTLDIIYEHNNIRAIMVQIEIFIQTLRNLWRTLSTLEYIGQHKDNIVVSQREQQTISKNDKKGFSILD